MLKRETHTSGEQGGSNGGGRPKRVERLDVGGGSRDVGASHRSARHECEFGELGVTL